MSFGSFLLFISIVYVTFIAAALEGSGASKEISPRTIILLIIIGVIAFILVWPREISSPVGEEDRNKPKKPC